MNTIITFEDHGQDFLKWIIDEDGEIIACLPFQFSIWNKWTVSNHSYHVGGKVHLYQGEEIMTIKYPIETIQLDNTNDLRGLSPEEKAPFIEKMLK